MDFPILTSCPQSCPEQVVDDTISSQSEAGYYFTRPRFTRVKYVYGPVNYVMNALDKVALQEFDAIVRGSVIFNWTHPITGDVKQVRFRADGRPAFEPIANSLTSNRLYAVDYTVEEA